MPREYTPAIDCTNEQRQAIALQPVTSNQIRAVGYDHDSRTLAVSFTRGAQNVYHYPEVEPEKACAFFMADSLGRHFGEHIAKLPSLKYGPELSVQA